MISFHNLSIRNKLTLTLMGISSLGVLTACLMFYVLVMSHYRQEYRNDAQSLAKIIGFNCTAALSFQVPDDAEKVLKALANRSSIIAAHIYDADGRLFAGYGVTTALSATPLLSRNGVVSSKPGTIQVQQDIHLDGTVIGKVILLDNMQSLKIFRMIALSTLSVIVSFVLILTLVAATKLREIIAKPIIDLDAISREIAKKEDYSLRAIKSSSDEIGQLVETFNTMLENIADRTAELKKSEQRFHGLVEQAVDAFFLHDTEGRFIDVNQRACDKLGYSREELLSMTVADIDADVDDTKYRDKSWDNLQPNKPVTLHGSYRCKDGSTLPMEVRVGLLEMGDQKVIMALARDISERLAAEEEKHKLEHQLQQAQKMESIGTMAAGIAHDFNNILSPIYGYVELALMKLQGQPEIVEYLTEAHNAASRAKDLVKQILTFSRQDTEKLAPIEVHVIIKEALKLLRSTIPTTIEIKQHIEANCGYVLANPTQIHQILMNLCTNAYHAMRETGGTLGVSLKPIELSPDDASRNIHLKPGPYLLLEVSDTGHGMDQETLAKIFEPYFTTKGLGEGTGMGLSVVHGIIKSHGGDITVYSEPGQGSSFHVYLPVIERAASEPLATASSNLPPGGTERILLVDDEESVAKVEKSMLESLGYRVQAFTSPQEALQHLRENEHRYDLVITDMTMPKMTGDKLAREILAAWPDMPVILCTGFSELINRESAMEIGIRQFVTKPIVLMSFARSLREVLDSTANNESEYTPANATTGQD